MNDDVIQLIFEFAGNVNLHYHKIQLMHAVSMYKIRQRRDIIRFLSYGRLRSGNFHSIKVIRFGEWNMSFHTKYTTPSGQHENILFWAERI